ncbi:MAG: hypothetical protein JRJ85_06510, partial [Deltaproteobacteria bacterium]|nr:hypothetical protein [Deltaproteobacteria bacterium]
MDTETYSEIGRGQPQIDALAKATGQAKYTADFDLPRMLVGKLLGSPHPHARVLDVDASRTGDTTISGLKFVSCELSRAIEESTRKAEWDKKRGCKDTNRGIGMACGGFVCGARGAGHTASGTNIHVN